jgi:hypothetical protein
MYFAWAENVDPLAASLRPSSESFAAWLSMTSAAPHGTAVVGSAPTDSTPPTAGAVDVPRLAAIAVDCPVDYSRE